nr:MAG TPA: hypothetical protein [Caudoviricetes sp.]DAK06446.1 MAG TPA: hypothetical protein [Caudoviricetes sp.]
MSSIHGCLNKQQNNKIRDHFGGLLFFLLKNIDMQIYQNQWMNQSQDLVR